MKKNVFVFSALLLGTTFMAVSCGPQPDAPVTREFRFRTTLSSGRDNVLYNGESDIILINEYNVTEATKARVYTVKVATTSDQEYVDITKKDNLSYTITPKKVTEGSKTVSVKITESGTDNPSQKIMRFTIKDQLVPQNAGINYSADNQKTTEILGKLEEYAMENSLTGITLFQEGAYVRYSSRVGIKASEYITGYGLGVLTEGTITGTLPGQQTAYQSYLHTASSSDPLTINAWDATGSQVSDLNGYVSSSYWGTRMKGTNAYEWYPVLAKDKVDGKDNNRPIPMQWDESAQDYVPMTFDTEEEYKQTLQKRWRVYVKTGAEEGIAYRYYNSASEFNGRLVALEDYEFVFQMLLTERTQVTRGTELALDTSYGIKGAQTYYRRTKNKTDETELDAIWAAMKADGELGIETGVDPTNGSYIEFELLSPVNPFYAMYHLSSSLYTPIPRDFLEYVGEASGTKNYMVGGKKFGTTGGPGILAKTLCVGPFYLQDWQNSQLQVFGRNDDWYECKDPQGGKRTRYLIDGVAIHVIDTSTDSTMIWKEFTKAQTIDYAALPKDEISKRLPTDWQSVGDATFKLNVNACTQERWNSLFGDNGSIIVGKDNGYECKEWMSNKNFLKGLYWSINRKKFADDRGVLPSINYFADAYMSDGENGVSYNGTEAHQQAISAFHHVDEKGNDDYGYDPSIASGYFRNAIDDLKIPYGTPSNPTVITIKITWMNQTDPRDYGDDIVKDFEAAFNENSVSQGCVKLKVEQEAVNQWDQVYNDHLMVGKFDLGFGAISGNTLSPLNFMEVLKSDNSSGFTLNWGNDTSKVDEYTPIMYDGKAWSYDALWTAADHGAVVKEGENVDPVEHGYMTSQVTTGEASNALYEGGDGAELQVVFNFVDVSQGVTLNLKQVQIYLASAGLITLNPGEYTYSNGKIIIPISQAQGSDWNSQIVQANKLDEKAEKIVDPDAKFAMLHPFTRDNYGEWWDVEVTYTLVIGEGIPADNTHYIARTRQEEKKSAKMMCLASR